MIISYKEVIILSTKKITITAIMTAVICLCSLITIPFFSVPFTMQTFGVFLALEILGAKLGAASIGTYILLGLVGVPVFSGFGAGPAHIIGPTGGYIIGFLFTAIVYLVFESLVKTGHEITKWICRVVGLLVCYLIGTIWFVTVMGINGKSIGIGAALTMCVLPFIIPDMIKIIFAVYIGKLIKKYAVKEI